MSVLRMAFTLAFVVISVVLIIVIAKQGSKNKGLSGALIGTNDADSYYSKNKKHSREGMIVRWSWILLAVFLGLSVVLNFTIL